MLPKATAEARPGAGASRRPVTGRPMLLPGQAPRRQPSALLTCQAAEPTLSLCVGERGGPLGWVRAGPLSLPSVRETPSIYPGARKDTTAHVEGGLQMRSEVESCCR